MADFPIRVVIDPTQATRGARRVERSLNQVNVAGIRARAILQSAFATGLGIAGIGALQGAIGGLVRTVADFEQAMSTVRAITGATEGDFRRLSDTARTLGRTTRFTATQAAEGMLFLARAGFDTNQVLGAVHGTLQLAQAGALDLGSAANIATNILTGFRLEVEQTGNVVDILAFAANSSNTNVQQLGDAMKFVAPVAAGLGVQIETATAAISALSNAGLQASLAGTGLRRVLAELESPAVKTQRILRALGLTAGDVRISQVGLTTALQRLRDAGVDAGLALEIFGDRGGPAFEVLQNAIPFVRQMEERLQSVDGFARNVAEIMDNNLRGALLAVASAAEGVVLSFADLGASSVLAQALGGLTQTLRFIADNMDIFVMVATAAGVILAVRLVPALLSTTRSMGLATQQTFALQLALARMQGVAGAAAGRMIALHLAARTLRSAFFTLGGPLGIIALVGFGLSEIIQTSSEVARSFNGLDEATDAFTRSFDTATGSIDDNTRSLENNLEARRRLLREGQGGIGGFLQRLVGAPGGFSLEELEAGRFPNQLAAAITRRRDDVVSNRRPELDRARQRALDEARRQAQIQGERPPSERALEARRLTEDLRAVDLLERAIIEANQRLIQTTQIEPRELQSTIETAFGTETISNRRAVEDVQRFADITRRQAERNLEDERIAARNFVTDLQLQSAHQLQNLNVTGERIDPNATGGTTAAERLQQQLQLREEAARRGRQLSTEERVQVLLTQKAYEDLTETQREAFVAQARRIDDAQVAAQQEREAAEGANERRQREVDATISAQQRIAEITAQSRQVTLAATLSDQDLIRQQADAQVQEVERLGRLRAVGELETSNAILEIRRAEQTQLNQIQRAGTEALEREQQEIALEHARALQDIQNRLVQVGLATRDVVQAEVLWGQAIRARLDLSTETGQQALVAIEQVIDQQRRLASQNPLAGFTVALEQFAASARTNAEAAAGFMTSAIEGATNSMADAFVQFAETGKFRFGDLIDGLLADLARLAANQIFRQIFGAILSGFAPGANAAGPVASGGAGPSFGGIRLGAGATGGLVTIGGDGVARILTGTGAIPAFGPGGLVRGPGTGRSDSVLARVSDGEFVVNARATRSAYPYLRALNESIPAFQRGGAVGEPPPVPGQRREAPVRFEFYDQRIVRSNEDSGTLTAEQSTGQNGQRNIRLFLRNNLRGEVGGGALDDILDRRYGVTPRRVRG